LAAAHAAAHSATIAAAWAAAKQLHERGVDARALTRAYDIHSYAPIGSRAWMRKMASAVRHMTEPEWIAHTIAKLRGEDGEDGEAGGVADAGS